VSGGDERPTLHGAPAFEAHPPLASAEGPAVHGKEATEAREAEDDEPTVMDEGALAAMMEAHHRQAAALAEPRVQVPAPVEETPRRGMLGWAARFLLITIVAFALGAGLTALWARFLR
jgi:hypothetical protein